MKEQIERMDRAPTDMTFTPQSPETKTYHNSTQCKRRHFEPKYKVRIVEEALSCHGHGQIKALLEREGLYSSELTLWRRQYRAGALRGIKAIKRGRKRSSDPCPEQLKDLYLEHERLRKKLQRASLIIQIQKNAANDAMNHLHLLDPATFSDL